MRNRNGRRAPVLRGALACALVLASTGCVFSKAARAPRGTSANTYTGGEGQEVEVTRGNPKLAKDLEIVNVRSERRDGRMHVQFELHNKKSRNLAFEWSVDWFDAAGFQVDFPQHWTPMSITGQGFETISITGPTLEAEQWSLAVQPPNSTR